MVCSLAISPLHSLTLPGKGEHASGGCYSDGMSHPAIESVPGQVTQPAPSNQPIPGRKRGLAPLIRSTKLRYPELSDAEIAKRVGCTGQNVGQVLSAFLSDKTLEQMQDFRESKAEIFEAVQYRTLASITQEDIAKASYLQRITGAAILEDKIRLLRGQPTSIHFHTLLDIAEMLKAQEDSGE